MAHRPLGVWGFWLAVLTVGVLTVLPTDMLPTGAFDFWDKAQHAIAFGILSFLGLIAYPKRHNEVIFGLILYGGLIEVVQAFIPWRSCEILDFLADVCGVIVIAMILQLSRMRL